RLLKLGGSLPVISHPNNFEFSHYIWKGEFKKDYLYEFINIKDGVVWNKPLSIIYLIKNIFIYPLTRRLLHKWNVLIPLERWSNLYFSRAKGLKIIGGLDLHIKLVYQEHTHGILIPSYKEGFKWLQNIAYSKEEIKTKEEVLNLLKEGKVFLSINETKADFWGFDGEKEYLFWEKMPVGSFLNCAVYKIKTIKILKWENNPIVITEEPQFSFKTEKEGLYHFEVYEYDFKIGDRYFGIRPVIITNMFEVVNADAGKESNS
ncbi:MAG: phosphoesterase, partial [Aquificae bacterium]|nr:phosphoesterase [Aquificota bacterium]